MGDGMRGEKVGSYTNSVARNRGKVQIGKIFVKGKKEWQE